MASMRKRSWHRKGQTLTAVVVDYVDLDGKRRLQTFQSERAANAFKAAIEYATRVDGNVTSFRQTPSNPQETTLADDLLYGVKTIAEFIGQPARVVFYMLEQKHLPATKVGTRWVASKHALARALKST